MRRGEEKWRGEGGNGARVRLGRRVWSYPIHGTAGSTTHVYQRRRRACCVHGASGEQGKEMTAVVGWAGTVASGLKCTVPFSSFTILIVL